MWLDSHRVALAGLDALAEGRAVCVPSRRYSILTGVLSRLSRSSRKRIMSRLVSMAPEQPQGPDRPSSPGRQDDASMLAQPFPSSEE
jgi:hypothetical protein